MKITFIITTVVLGLLSLELIISHTQDVNLMLATDKQLQIGAKP